MRLLRGLFGRPAALDPQQAHSAAEAGAMLLDVRESDEWRAGHAPGATHIPLRQLEQRMAEVPQDRQVVTVCRSGHRSAIAANMLNRAGVNVVNLRGGMTAWASVDLRMVTDDGKPGRVV